MRFGHGHKINGEIRPSRFQRISVGAPDLGLIFSRIHLARIKSLVRCSGGSGQAESGLSTPV